MADKSKPDDAARKSMSDFGITDPKLQDMVHSFMSQAGKGEDKKPEDRPRMNPLKRYSAPQKRTNDKVGPDGMIEKGVRP